MKTKEFQLHTSEPIYRHNILAPEGLIFDKSKLSRIKEKVGADAEIGFGGCIVTFTSGNKLGYIGPVSLYNILGSCVVRDQDAKS